MDPQSAYSSLPGIDYSSPDVFETDDPDKSLKDAAKTGTESFEDDNIVSTELDHSAAFSRFKNTHMTEYEMHAFGSADESLPARIRRLQVEADQCIELSRKQQAEVSKKVESDKTGRSEDMFEEMAALQAKLSMIHRTSILGAEGAAATDQSSPLYAELLQQIDAAKSSIGPVGAEGEADGGGGGGGEITYQIKFSGNGGEGASSRDDISNAAAAAELEKRLDKLERVIGKDISKLSSFTGGSSGTEETSLLDSFKKLGDKVKLLDAKYLEQVESRLNLLNQQLVQLSDKRHLVQNKEREEKVNELYETVKKWDSVADVVPHLIQRLEQLKILHEQALQMSQALSQLDLSQHEVQTTLDKDTQLLNELQSSMKTDLEAMEASCKRLEERIQLLPSSTKK